MKSNNQFQQLLFLSIISLFILSFSYGKNLSFTNTETEKPKIVNIVNFIRLLEPRDSAITEDVLYQTVVKQVDMMKQYKLGGTFLLQYDALLDSRYQNLLKNLSRDSFEIGGWWEIPQPLVEKAGLKWRGRYPWDWHADVGFSTGYTPQEREKLVDVYMTDFKNIFGYYPKTVGSWFIDARTLNYLYNKYKIVASCNCKDQYGTDGYTLWGGYWNQAYYPSKINSYMPAQHEQNQTPVPIFRMLGSDPVRQYDNGLGTSRQGVITLEPVYKDGGGDSTWVNWFFKQFTQGECIEFAYTQAGQENSFTWDAMSKGFEIQMPLLAKLRDERKVKIETLAESGKWFQQHYKTTPATSVTVTEDLPGSDRKTVWFNSRFYRANVLWENNTLRFRDIHVFNETFPSFYTNGKATSNECSFYTLPVVDGYLWSKPNHIAGLRFMANINGKEMMITGKNPVIKSPSTGKLVISWPLQNVNGTLKMNFDEKQISIHLLTKDSVKWHFDLSVADSVKLPFETISSNRIACRFDGFPYAITTSQGSFIKRNGDQVLRMIPDKNTLVLQLAKED